MPVGDATAAEMERLTALLDDLAAEIGCREPWALPARPRARPDLLPPLAAPAVRRRGGPATTSGSSSRRHAHQARARLLRAPGRADGGLGRVVLPPARRRLHPRPARGGRGMQSVSEAMAADLEVHLDTPVRTILSAPTRPGALRRVRPDHPHRPSRRRRGAAEPLHPHQLRPPLPRRQHQMHQHLSLGLVIKVHAVYDRPFLARAGPVGHLLRPELAGAGGLRQHQPRRPPAARWSVFVSDEKAVRPARARRRRAAAAVLGSIAEYLGADALAPEVYARFRLGQRGVDQGRVRRVLRPRWALALGRHQTAPVGRIHWACSDTAAEGNSTSTGHCAAGRPPPGRSSTPADPRTAAGRRPPSGRGRRGACRRTARARRRTAGQHRPARPIGSASQGPPALPPDLRSRHPLPLSETVMTLDTLASTPTSPSCVAGAPTSPGRGHASRPTPHGRRRPRAPARPARAGSSPRPARRRRWSPC